MGNSLPLPASARRETTGVHLFGRTAELAVVRDLIRRATNGSGATVLVGGGPGMGKSAFLLECAALATPGMVLHHLTCRRGEPVEPAFVEWMAAVAAAPAKSGLARTAGLNRWQKHPTLCIVDDLQFASSLDLDVFEMMVNRAVDGPTMIVAAYSRDRASRNHHLDQAIPRWLRNGTRALDLQPLDQSAIELILRERSAAFADRLDAQERARLVEAAAGNPRYAEDLLEQFHDRNPATASFVPASARAQLQVHRSSFEPATFSIVRTASVIGLRFEEGWLERMVSASPVAVSEALQAATDAEILRERGSGSFEFADPALRNAFYESLIASKRLSEHARIAGILVDERTDDDGDALIARHFAEAGDSPNAIRWLVQAAKTAADQRRFGDAVELYKRASELLERGSDAWWMLERSIAIALAERAEFKEATAYRRRLIKHHLSRGERTEAEAQLFFLMLDYWHDAQPRLARAAYLALRRMNTPESRLTLAELDVEWLRFWVGADPDDARRVIKSIDPERLPEEARASYFVVMGMLDGPAQPIERTIQFFEAAVEIAEKAGAQRDAFVIRINAASRASDLGYVEFSNRWLEAADAARNSVPVVSGGVERLTAVVRSEIHALYGRLEDAQRELQTVVFNERAGKLWEICSAGLATFIGMRMGRMRWVNAYFRPELLESAVAARHAEACGLVVRGFAEIMHERDRAGALVRALERCVDLNIVDPRYSIQIECARHGNPNRFEKARAQIEAGVAGARTRVARPSLDLFDAFASLRSGRRTASAAAASRAGAGFEAIGWSLHHALALELSGDRLGAASLYERCGASRDALRVMRGTSRKERRAAFGMALTSRERQIAGRILEGSTNRQVAAALGLSERTVIHHTEAIFSKLGIRARWQLTLAHLADAPRTE